MEFVVRQSVDAPAEHVEDDDLHVRGFWRVKADGCAWVEGVRSHDGRACRYFVRGFQSRCTKEISVRKALLTVSEEGKYSHTSASRTTVFSPNTRLSENVPSL